MCNSIPHYSLNILLVGSIEITSHDKCQRGQNISSPGHRPSTPKLEVLTVLPPLWKESPGYVASQRPATT